MKKIISNMEHSSWLCKHCTNCGGYDERMDDPDLIQCPFCYSTLIKNQISQITYILDGGRSDTRIPTKLVGNSNKKLKKVWNPASKLYEDYDRFM